MWGGEKVRKPKVSEKAKARLGLGLHPKETGKVVPESGLVRWANEPDLAEVGVWF